MLARGGNEKAAELLQQGLQLDPTGIDSNYFYAKFLAEQKQSDQALEHYRKALNAPAREGRAIADEGRRKQVQSAIDAIGT